MVDGTSRGMKPAIQSHDQLDLPDRLAGLAGNLLGRHSRGGQGPGLAVPLAELAAGAALPVPLRRCPGRESRSRVGSLSCRSSRLRRRILSGSIARASDHAIRLVTCSSTEVFNLIDARFDREQALGQHLETLLGFALSPLQLAWSRASTRSRPRPSSASPATTVKRGMTGHRAGGMTRILPG